MALYREAVDLVPRGVCTAEDIDRAVCFGPGLRFALMGEMANRPPDQGNTVEQISEWRDDGLVELLKMIKKL